MGSNPSVAPQEIPPVYEVTSGSVFRWLQLGWQDMWNAGTPSFAHGAIVTFVSLLILSVALLFWPMMPGVMSGFVLVGPILATGLYSLSQQLGKGNKPTFTQAVNGWRNGGKCLFRFGILLILAGTAWVVVSVLMFYFFIDIEINHPLDFVRYVLTQGEQFFFLWTILGGLGAALAFALTVVSTPLLVDKDVTTKLALLTSLRAVGQNPVPMFLWAVVIMVATGLSFATLMLGFIVLYPLMGHASWHVYRDLVDASKLPSRNLAE